MYMYIHYAVVTCIWLFLSVACTQFSNAAMYFHIWCTSAAHMTVVYKGKLFYLPSWACGCMHVITSLYISHLFHSISYSLKTCCTQTVVILPSWNWLILALQKKLKVKVSVLLATLPTMLVRQYHDCKSQYMYMCVRTCSTCTCIHTDTCRYNHIVHVHESGFFFSPHSHLISSF